MAARERINILMVDDSSPNLLALESILRAPDRNLIRASSGEEALRYLLDHDVAVILMDVYMPGIDGLETAELIRGREKSRDIPIIFLTADSSGSRHLSRGYSLGAVDYIVKPVEPDILRSKVAVFVELFKKTQEIKHQTRLLKQKNLELENANLARLEMLIELGQELALEHDPSQVLERFCSAGRRIVGAEIAAAAVIDQYGNKLNYFCSTDSSDNPKHQLPAAAEKAVQQLLVVRQPLRLTDADTPLSDTGQADLEVRSFLGAPILAPSGTRGWICLVNKIDGDAFSEADERLAATFATQVAIAYENARLYTEAQNHASQLRIEVAERKQAEEERARLLVREQAARAEAETANRAKDQFLATLSHELRTPLSAILGWSQLLRTGKLEEKQMTRAMDTIERNARSQSQLIDDLLDVTRIISGKLQIDLVQVDLAKVIEAATDSVRPAYEAKEISFSVRGGQRPCLVRGDANRLQQIFWNLFNNAVKFTPASGEVTVNIKQHEFTVEVSVTDTGIGIDPKFLPYIFERFRQADGSTTRSHGGLGLGLAIVRHLVELHTGQIKVESGGEGCGSTFTVNLPLATAPFTAPFNVARESEPAEESKPAGADYSRALDGLRILVVDDEADSRDLLKAILTRCGGQVRCSECAAEAIEAVKNWQPDVLVSDIGMPVDDGYSLIKSVRQLASKGAKQIPAVALTAYATVEDRAKALAAGFQMHLAKPVEPHSLVKSIAAAGGRNLSH